MRSRVFVRYLERRKVSRFRWRREQEEREALQDSMIANSQRQVAGWAMLPAFFRPMPILWRAAVIDKKER
jgi:hypothetical protein